MANTTIMEEPCPVMTKFTDDEQILFNKATQIEKSLHDYKSQTQKYNKRMPIASMR